MNRNRNGLSKNLLQMKFMQRKKLPFDNEPEKQRYTNSKIDQELLNLCKTEGDRYMTTNSFLLCEDLRYGRMSYKGMNPEIEKLVKSKNRQFEDEEEDEEISQNDNEVEVTNVQMAKAFKKFKSKK